GGAGGGSGEDGGEQQKSAHGGISRGKANERILPPPPRGALGLRSQRAALMDPGTRQLLEDRLVELADQLVRRAAAREPAAPRRLADHRLRVPPPRPIPSRALGGQELRAHVLLAAVVRPRELAPHRPPRLPALMSHSVAPCPDSVPPGTGARHGRLATIFRHDPLRPSSAPSPAGPRSSSPAATGSPRPG